jgi:hypothetical protein
MSCWAACRLRFLGDTGAAFRRQSEIIKLFARPYRKDNFAQRRMWTFKTNTRPALSLWPAMRWADEILFPGSPPLFLHWIAPLNLFLRKRLVYRITDFHPECLIAARAPVRVADAGLCLTLFWRRRARRVIKGAMISIDEARIRKLPGRFSCSRADRVRLWRRQLSSTALARRNRPGLSQPPTRRALACSTPDYMID